MSEQLFRYVRCERAAAWEAVGWSVISGPVELKPPPELEGSARAVPMMIVEWAKAESPVEPPASLRW
jgi:hypothetical protein